MRLAFAIASLFGYGGLQRDCICLATSAVSRGHEVTIFTSDLRGRVETPARIEVVATQAFTNPERDRQLGLEVAARRRRFDRIVGFNKMPGIDILYCADGSYARQKGMLSRWNPKYAAQLALERGCFEPGAHLPLILLSGVQAESFQAVWGTPRSRIALLPPILAPERRRPELRGDETLRASVRATLAIDRSAFLWLAVAGVPKTKGLDRSLAALARHPDAVLVVAGVAADSRAGLGLLRDAHRLGVAARLRLLGYRDDIPRLMAAADLLVHPARTETTGTVILEAIVNGLPAVVSDVCGYALHVKAAAAGLVCATPFDAGAFDAALGAAADADLRRLWSANGRSYGADPALSSGLPRALDLILGPLWGGRDGGAPVEAEASVVSAV